MKIYGQTDEIIVREMTKSDCGRFLELMVKHGTNMDFTVEDIQVLWELRKQNGDLQGTVTSIDDKIIYGFCGILRSEVCTDFFSEYSGRGYEEQARTIIMTEII